MAPNHATPEFFERNGFCSEDCEECNRIDQANLAAGMSPGEIVNRAMNLALAAIEREQEQEND
jgi:hypothetical protein